MTEREQITITIYCTTIDDVLRLNAIICQIANLEKVGVISGESYLAYRFRGDEDTLTLLDTLWSNA